MSVSSINSKKVIIGILFTVMLVYLIPYFIFDFFNDSKSILKLKDNLNHYAVTSDGKVTIHDKGDRTKLMRNDVVTYFYDVPKSETIANPMLYLRSYHSGITVYYDDELLYDKCNECVKNGDFVGGINSVVKLPKEVLGKQVKIELTCAENKLYNIINDIFVYDSNKTSSPLLLGHKADFIIFITIFILSIFLFAICNILKKSLILAGELISFCILSVTLSLYLLSYYGLLNIFIDIPKFSTSIEYPIFFFVPIGVLAYFKNILNKKILKELSFVLEMAYVFFEAIAILLNYFTEDFHYSKFVTPFHIFGIITILFILTCLCIDDNKKDSSRILICVGIGSLIIAILIQIVVFNLSKYKITTKIITTLPFLSIGIMVFLAFLVLSIIVSTADNVQMLEYQKQLENMAYQDAMTGLMNRAKANDVIKKVDAYSHFAVVYFDLNNLKTTNDTYGHDVGDLYIRSVAAAIKDSFGNHADLCARMGGDEFLVILSGNNVKKSDYLIDIFNDRIKKINEMRSLPLDIVVAVGVVVSTEDNVGITEALKLADQRMYVDKKAKKGEH